MQMITKYLNPSRRLVTINDQKLVKPSKFMKIFTIIMISAVLLWTWNEIDVNFLNIHLFSKIMSGFSNFEPIKVGAHIVITASDTFSTALELLWSTITFSLTGTVLGIFLSIPLSFLASKKIMKYAIIWWPVKTIVSIIRSIPPIVYAFMFVLLFTPSMAAMLSLGVFVSVIMTKWMAEELDSMDLGAYETLISFGNKKIHAIRHGIMPTFMKRVVSYGMYAFEMVLRFATILAFVNIPTIGFMFTGNYKLYTNWGHLLISLSILVVTVIAIEAISTNIKKYVLDRQEKQIEIESTTTVEQIEEVMAKDPKSWIIGAVLSVALLGILAASVMNIEFGMNTGVKIEQFMQGLENLFNPDWSYITDFGTGANAIELALEVVLIAIGSVVFGTFFGLIFGVLASRNISIITIAWFFRIIIIISRTIPTFVYALVCILIVANGSPFAAVLAMGTRSIGMLGKLTYEKIESIDMGGKQSMEVSGNNVWNTTRLAVISEALPTIISNSLYRIEINFKSITDVGVVGASAFGFQLYIYSGSPNLWSRLAPYVLVMIVFVLVIEQISNALRKKVTDGHFVSKDNFIKKRMVKIRERRNLAVASLGYSSLNESQMTQNYDFIKALEDKEFLPKLKIKKDVIYKTKIELINKYILEYTDKIDELDFSITEENKTKVTKIIKDIKKNKKRYAINKAKIKVKELFT